MIRLGVVITLLHSVVLNSLSAGALSYVHYSAGRDHET